VPSAAEKGYVSRVRDIALSQPRPHMYRDVRAPRIDEGASEVQRPIIARELFKERKIR
jgi:acyl-CoA dehydrogenase